MREDANSLRFHLSPHSTIALAARVKRAGKEFVGEQREFLLLEEEPGEQSPYERLLADAMDGDGALFAREDAIEAAWAAVEPVLVEHPPVHLYAPGSWGPPAANHFIAADGGWRNPERAPEPEAARMNATRSLHRPGQSLRLDNITRTLLRSGTLARYIRELSVTGLTSNPTIFEHAIGAGDSYDAGIRALAEAGLAGEVRRDRRPRKERP